MEGWPEEGATGRGVHEVEAQRVRHSQRLELQHHGGEPHLLDLGWSGGLQSPEGVLCVQPKRLARGLPACISDPDSQSRPNSAPLADIGTHICQLGQLLEDAGGHVHLSAGKGSLQPLPFPSWHVRSSDRRACKLPKACGACLHRSKEK